MTSLSGKPPSMTYKDLLQVSNDNAGIDATLRPISDGEGTASALLVSGTAVRATGPLDFAGTGHAGLRLNNLTTAQRDALTPPKGCSIFNTTTGRAETYNGTAWADSTAGSITALTGDAEAGADGVVTVKKIDGQAPATVATTGSYNDLTNKPALFSGSYADLAGKPVLASVATTGSYGDLSNRPALFSGDYADLTGRPTLFSGAYADLSGKPALAPVATSGAYGDLSGKPSLAPVAGSGSYNDLADRPTLGTAAALDASAFLASTVFSSLTPQSQYLGRYKLAGYDEAGNPALLTPDADAVLASNYIRANATVAQIQDDLQAGLDAAVGTDTSPGIGHFCINKPGIYYLTKPLTNKYYGQVPSIVSADTTTGDIGFGISLRLQDGDAIELQGAVPAGLVERTRYFVRYTSYGVYRLYATSAQAKTGGTTGLLVPTSSPTTTGTVDLATTTDVVAGSNAVPVDDIRAIAVGSVVQLTSGVNTAVRKVASIAPTTGNAGLVTFTTTLSNPGLFPAGTTIILNSLVVANLQNAVVGNGVAVQGVSSGSGGFVITAIDPASKRLTINQVPPATFAGATVTFGAVVDERYINLRLKISGVPGVELRKAGSFVGQAMIDVSLTGEIEVTGFRFKGRFQNYAPNTILEGDDGVRAISTHKATVWNNTFVEFGDSAIRTRTGTFDKLSATATQPDQGVNSSSIHVFKNKFFCIAQTSTTTNDFFHGGAKGYWFHDNTVEKLALSIKVANRILGARNIFMFNNVIKDSGRHGFEIDSVSNLTLENNHIYNPADSGIALLSNNSATPADQGGGVVGFPWHNVKVRFNHIHGAAKYGIRVQYDSYLDGFLFDQYGTEISNNYILDTTSATAIGIHYASGSPKGLSIEQNWLINFAGICGIKVEARANGVAGFRNVIRVERNNIINMTRASASGQGIFISQSGGTALLQGVICRHNTVDGINLDKALYFDGINDLQANDNTVTGLNNGPVFFGTQTITNLELCRNRFTSTGTTGASIDNVTGGRIEGNTIATAGATVLTINNTCADILEFDNKLSGGRNFKQVPVNTRQASMPGRYDQGTALPTAGTYPAGSDFDLTNAAASSAYSYRATTGGTAGTLAGVAGDSTVGSNVITNVTGGTGNLARGAYITHPGWSGARLVLALTSTTITVGTVAGVADNATTAATAGAVAYSAPVWKSKGNLAA